MTTGTIGTSARRYARLAGVLYLLLFFLGPVAFLMGRTGVFVPGDPTESINNLLASESTFRLGMAAETAVVLIEIVITGILYALLRPVSRPFALASVLARFAQSVLQAVNLFTAVPALLLLAGAGSLAAFETGQLNALVHLFMDVNAFVILIWGLLFGFHLLLLGYLVYQSGFWPKVLGILLVIGGIGYLLQSYGHLLAPQFDSTLATVVLLLSIPGELAFTIWLLWKGLDGERWQERNALETV